MAEDTGRWIPVLSYPGFLLTRQLSMIRCALQLTRTPEVTVDRDEKGKLMWAFLVTDYFAIETRTKAPVSFVCRAKRRTHQIVKLRKLLAEAQSRFGVTVIGESRRYF